MCVHIDDSKALSDACRHCNFKVYTGQIVEQVNMYQIISLVVLCLFALSDARITTCDSPFGHVDVKDVKVTNCDVYDNKCILRLGTNVTIEFLFTIEKPVQTVKVVVKGIIMHVPIPFPFEDDEACKVSAHSGLQCPLSPGKFQYKASLPVQNNYPKTNVDVQWQLLNELDQVIACIKIPAKLEKL